MFTKEKVKALMDSTLIKLLYCADAISFPSVKPSEKLVAP